MNPEEHAGLIAAPDDATNDVSYSLELVSTYGIAQKIEDVYAMRREVIRRMSDTPYDLKQRIKRFSSREEYEKAALLRDQLSEYNRYMAIMNTELQKVLPELFV